MIYNKNVDIVLNIVVLTIQLNNQKIMIIHIHIIKFLIPNEYINIDIYNIQKQYILSHFILFKK